MLHRFYKQGRYQEAEQLYIQSREIREKSLGKDHPDVAAVVRDLAYLYASQGKYQLAEVLYKSSQSILEEAYGKEHPDLAYIKSDIAWIYFKMANYEEAEKLYKSSLEMRKKILGLEHPDVARSFHELAELCHKLERYDEAEKYNEQGLAIRRQLFGNNISVDLATSLFYSAMLFCSKGNYAQALRLQEEARSNLEKLLGPSHPKGKKQYNLFIIQITEIPI